MDIQDCLGAVERGCASVPVDVSTQQAAATALRHWLTAPTWAAYQEQLQWLIATAKWPLLVDSFYRLLPFGTGGRRGPVGIGPNRFNPWTLAASVQGHVAYLQHGYASQDLAVVIAYDVRVFQDIRGLYHRDIANPVLGLTSRDFARVAAGVYTANGIRVYMLPEEASTYISTPELSFTIRALRATAGLNISASHNHPDDNGGKFYNAHGAQDVAPNDAVLAAAVEGVTQIKQLDLATAKATGLITWIDPAVHKQYITLNVNQSLQPARQARIVFTPLHGTAITTVGEVLQQAGFQVDIVAAQASLDGTFPAVPFRAPNPEVPEAMQQGMQLASTLGADVVFACDPDADRLGVCSRTPEGTYRFLTGNEIAVLVTHYKLEQLRRLGTLPAHPLVIKTAVTTELLTAITNHFGARLIGDLLVGFKYHANVLEHLERHHGFGAVQATLDDFVIAVEESHGILVTPALRDKDAAGAALLLAELTALQRQHGRTLLDYLEDIYRRYGYHANLGTSMVMTGADGNANIQAIQQALRAHGPSTIGGWQVTQVADRLHEPGSDACNLSATERASRNVLLFRLRNGAQVTIRPSGTEPKTKVYVEVPSAPLGLHASRESLAHQRAQTDAIAQQLVEDFTRQMLATIGIHLPDYALRISSLVPLDKRLDFVERFLPEFTMQARACCQGQTTPALVSCWVDTHLASYGKDARGLVGEAFTAYVQHASQHAQDPEERRCLDMMTTIFHAASQASVALA